MLKNRGRHLSLLPLFALIFFITSIIVGCGEVASVTSGLLPVATGSVTLAWEPPTTNEDGSPLIDLAGFRVYYGTSSGDYIDVINVGYFSSCSLDSLDELPTDQALYFSVTAYDSFGNESAYSNEISAIIPGT